MNKGKSRDINHPFFQLTNLMVLEEKEMKEKLHENW